MTAGEVPSQDAESDFARVSPCSRTDDAGLFLIMSEGDSTELSVDDCDITEGDGVGMCAEE